MKVALIGDIHGNLPALEAVLAHVHKQNVDAIWNIGDWVGYGPFPNAVIQRLRQEQVLSIVGNYDLKVLKFKKKEKKWRKRKHPQKFLAFKWAYETLTEDNLNYLRTLPLEIQLTYTKLSVLLTHGTPASNKEPIMPDTPIQRLRELAQMAGTDVIVCGHSHWPSVREVAGVWFINTGSVGRPDDGDPRAAYAVMQLAKKEVQVQHYRLTYDVERAVAAIQQHNLPQEFGQMLLQGVSLNNVK